ncbi:MAG TPA: MFS transporter [Galbitalea sp.]|nr:MFS transporter [Galbitalea sp.]
MSPTASRAAAKSPAVPSEVRAWRNAVFVVFAACGVSAASMAARIPTISLALGLNTAQVGLLLFGIAVGSIAGLLAAGHVVSHFGSKRTIVVVYTLASVGLVLAAFGIGVAHSFVLSFVGLIVFGLAIATCDVAMNLSGAANERALGRSIMPVYHAFFSIGTIIGAALGTLAEALHLPLQWHITILEIVLVAAVLIAAPFLLPEAADRARADGTVNPPSTWRSRLAIWKEPATILIGLIVLGAAFTEGSANDWLSYAMVHGHGTTRATGALVYSIFVTAMTIGRLSGVRFLDRWGRVPVLRSAAILAGVGLILFIFVPVYWVEIVGVILWGLGASLGFPVGMSAAADDPQRAAARVSAVATIGYCAFLVGPPVLGFLGNQFGILHGLLLVLVLAALGGIVSFAARSKSAPADTSGEVAEAAR